MPPEVSASDVYVAVLECYADVSVRDVDGYFNKSAVLEIYALTDAYFGELDAEKFTRPSAMIRNVPLGQGKRIVIDITEIVKYYLDQPGKNYGLVFGSLTGLRVGMFNIRAGKFGPGILAKISILYEH